MTNQPPAAFAQFASTNTVMSRLFAHFGGHDSSTASRLLLIIALAVCVHLAVKIIRHFSEWLIYKSYAKKNPLGFVTQQPKFITVTRLIVSAIIFVIYFLRWA